MNQLLTAESKLLRCPQFARNAEIADWVADDTV